MTSKLRAAAEAIPHAPHCERFLPPMEECTCPRAALLAAVEQIESVMPYLKSAQRNCHEGLLHAAQGHVEKAWRILTGETMPREWGDID